MEMSQKLHEIRTSVSGRAGRSRRSRSARSSRTANHTSPAEATRTAWQSRSSNTTGRSSRTGWSDRPWSTRTTYNTASSSLSSSVVASMFNWWQLRAARRHSPRHRSMLEKPASHSSVSDEWLFLGPKYVTLYQLLLWQHQRNLCFRKNNSLTRSDLRSQTLADNGAATRRMQKTQHSCYLIMVKDPL